MPPTHRLDTPHWHGTSEKDPDVLEAEVRRAMIEHSEEPVLLVDGSKFEKRDLSVITRASKLTRALVTDAPDERLQSLILAGVEVRRV
jgi:DeoR/GlpR family transcriptional regulator of sugar metabolism